MKKLIIGLALVFGVFALSENAEARRYYERDYVTCESHGYNYRECGSYKIRQIDRVRLVRQHSKTFCQRGRNWGANRWGIWVDGGCRATFEVTGWTR